MLRTVESPIENELEAHRKALTGYCYRMIGSGAEAEDAVQETMVRAWKSVDKLQERGALKAWLYRIANNVCLDMLQSAQRPATPMDMGPSSNADAPLGNQLLDSAYVRPIADAKVLDEGGDPAALAADKESLRLAFVAALQHLPAKQRAVLILRDVLRWSAAEVAGALDTTTAAVNSALQRAHAQMAERGLTEDSVEPELSPAQRQLLDRYVDAFWRKDVDTIVSLLTAEATWDMPPFTSWFKGATNIGWLIGTECPGGAHDMPMLETRANGQPAYGLYMRTAAGDFVPFQLQVLELDGDRVKHVTAFFDHALFATFGLPERLPAEHAPSPR